jgi:hypothetical protein
MHGSQKSSTPSEIALAVYENNDENVEITVKKLTQSTIRGTTKEYREIRNALIAKAWLEIVQKIKRSKNGWVRKEYGPKSPARLRREAYRADVASRTLLQYKVGNKPLGECTRVDLLNAINGHEKQANTEMHIARWYRSIARALPNDTTKVKDITNAEKFVEKAYKETN